MTKIRTHYDNLKVSHDAPPAVIDAAYIALMRKYRPDNYQGDKDEAYRIINIVRQSYDVLSNPVKRAEHDQWIEKQEAVSSTQTESDTTKNTIDQYRHKHGIPLKTPQIEPPNCNLNANTTDSLAIKPAKAWPRLLARTFDLTWESLIFGSLIFIWLSIMSKGFATWSNQPQAEKVFLIIITPLLLCIDACTYHLFGNTPGKSLLGLTVKNSDYSSLSFTKYLKRNFYLWKSGLAFGIPFVCLYPFFKQAAKVDSGRLTTYDEKIGCCVCAEPRSKLKRLTFIVLFIFIFLLMRFIASLDEKVASHYAAPTNRDTNEYKDDLRKNSIEFTQQPFNTDNYLYKNYIHNIQRSVRVKNNCHETASIAITYWDGSEWVTQGWLNLNPFSESSSGISTSKKEVYAYAVSKSFKWESQDDKGFLRPIFDNTYTIRSSASSVKGRNDAKQARFFLASIAESSDSNEEYFRFELFCQAPTTPPVTPEQVQEQHTASIASIHPDYQKIANDPNFYRWINAQSAENQSKYQEIVKSGTADQVITMLTAYKYYLLTKNDSFESANGSSRNNCEIKAAMSDEDYRKCGLKAPRP